MNSVSYSIQDHDLSDIHETLSLTNQTVDVFFRLYGKRLALSDGELCSQAPPEPEVRKRQADKDDVLIFADEPCDCPEIDSEGCSTCAAFTIKMGAFVNICKLLSS